MEMIDYQTRRTASPLPMAAIPAADDRMAVAIREALRDRQAAGSRKPTGRAVTVDSHSAAVLAMGAL